LDVFLIYELNNLFNPNKVILACEISNVIVDEFSIIPLAIKVDTRYCNH
jgi:hypothetical protein